MSEQLQLERAIRLNFPGPYNAGIRKMLRRCRSAWEVRAVALTVGLTYQGRASLDAVAAAVEDAAIAAATGGTP